MSAHESQDLVDQYITEGMGPLGADALFRKAHPKIRYLQMLEEREQLRENDRLTKEIEDAYEHLLTDLWESMNATEKREVEKRLAVVGRWKKKVARTPAEPPTWTLNSRSHESWTQQKLANGRWGWNVQRVGDSAPKPLDPPSGYHPVDQSHCAIVASLDKERNELRAALREALDGWAHANVPSNTNVFPATHPYADIARLRLLLTGDHSQYNLREERDGLKAALVLAMNTIERLKEEIVRRSALLVKKRKKKHQ